MDNSQYSENNINVNLQPLLGYNLSDEESFKLVNKSISSWSFDGSLPSSIKDILIWNSSKGKIDVSPGDYLILAQDGVATVRPIIKVYSDPEDLFFDRSEELEVVEDNVLEVTAYSGDGTTATYIADNDFIENDKVKIYGLDQSGFNVNGAIVTSATSTQFTIASSQTGSYTDDGSVYLLSSFRSDFLIKYLDENNDEIVIRQPLVFEGEHYPINRIQIITSDWENKSLGNTGWALDSFGNSIFNNVAVRGEIEATSGNFSGNLTVNNGTMRIGAEVSSAKTYSPTAFRILNNEVILTIGAHTLAIGDTILVEEINSVSLTAPTVPPNATITNVSGSGTNITYTASNTFSPGMFVETTGITPVAYNFSFAEILSATSTNFVLAGTATSSYVSGGSASIASVPGVGTDINGEHEITGITSTTIKYSLIANNFSQTSIASGTVKLNSFNDGIFINQQNYWYDDGHFQVGNADSTVTWNPDTSLLNITGDISASQIRGTDVYANSAQLGGNEFGWVIGSGDIFSGTYGSTSYLKSGFYSIPIIDFQQETEVVDGKTIIKVNQVSGSARLSGNPRGVFASISNSSLVEIKVGYQLYETLLVNNVEVRGDFIGIVEEILTANLIKLKDSPRKFYDSIRFGAFYVNTTVTSQFTVFEKLPVDGSGNANLSFEGPADKEYHANNIPVVVDSIDSRIIITKSIPPIWNVDKTPKEYLSKSLFLSLSNVSSYKKESDITRIRTVQTILANGDEAYNSYIYASNADDYVPGDVIFVSNISRYYDEVTALNGSYLPVIKIGQDSFGKYVLVYTDGYLGESHDTQFSSLTATSIKIDSGEVTIQTSSTPRFDVGQTINISLFGIKEIEEGVLNAYNLNKPGDLPFQDSGVITEVSSNTIKYRKNFSNLISSSVGTGSIAFSYPSMNTKESEKSYSITVGSSKPDDAPFQIDQFGENVKIKNLEVTGSVTGFYYDIIELDDFSGSFNGRKNTFLPRYNQKNVVLDNPLRLSVSLNGVVQSAFIRNKEYVWQTGFLSYKGYTVDGDGNLKFSESPPSGSTINVKVLPGPNTNKTSRIYPFKAVDVALG
jgi:hypothetical protein